MILDLVHCDSEILRTKMEKFDFTKSEHNQEFVHNLCNNLIETMTKYQGLGLSANQCGLPYRVFVMWTNPTMVCFNPKIVSYEDDEIYFTEGCLSYPNLYVKIKRPSAIRVRYQKPNGDVETDRLMGMSARIFQHELDHLDGIVYTSRASRIHFDRGMRVKKAHDRIVKKGNKNEQAKSI